MSETSKKVILDVQIRTADSVKRLAEIRKEQEALKKTNKELGKSYAENAEQIVFNEARLRELGTEQGRLQKIIDGTTGSNEAQAGSLKAQKELLTKLTTEYSKLSQEERQSEEVGGKLAAQIREIATDLTLEQKALKAVRQEEELREGSLAHMRKQLSQLTAEYVKLSKEERENIEVGGKMKVQIKGLSDELKRQEGALGDFRRNVGDYKNAFKEAGTELLRQGGNLSSFSGAAAGIASAFPGYGQAIGTAIELIGQPVEELITDFVKLKGEIQNLTGLSGPALDELAARVDAVAKTFDEDAVDITNSANAIAKQLNVSFDQALVLIEKGFLSGANQSGEFLDQIKEYAPQFRDAGLAADEFIATISQNVKDGVFSDKGVDVLKEAGLRLRENTKATSDALKVLGKEANAEIQAAIANGDTFKAIQLVSKGLNEVTLTASETQTIIADVFGGPGEDAGLQYLQSLQNINLELDKQIDYNNELVQRQQETLRINKEFSQQLSELTGQFEGFGEGAGNFFKQLGTGFLVFLNGIITGFKVLFRQGQALGDVIKGIFTLDADLIKKGLSDAANATLLVAAETAERRANADAKETARIRTQEAERAAFLEKQRKAELDKLKEQQAKANKELYAKQLADQKALLERRLLEVQKGSEQELKLRIGLLKNAQKTELENDKLTANQRKLIAARTEQEIFGLRREFFLKGQDFDQIQLKQLDQLRLEEAAAYREMYDAITKGEEEVTARLLKLRAERATLERRIAEKEAEEDLKAEKERQNQFLTDFTKNADRQLQQTLELEQAKQDIRQRDRDNELSLLQGQGLAVLTERQRIAQQEIAIEQAKYDAISTLADTFSAVGTLLAKTSAGAAEFQKDVALFQIGIDTAKAISGAVAQAQVLPFPGNLLAVATGVTTVLANIAKAKALLTQEAPKPPSFYEGGMFGYTGEGQPTAESTALGKKPYTYHRRELIVPDRVLATPEGRYHGGQLLAMMRATTPEHRVKGFANGGFGPAAASVAATVGVQRTEQEATDDLAGKLLAGIRQMPPQVLQVSELERVQDRRKSKIDGGLR